MGGGGGGEVIKNVLSASDINAAILQLMSTVFSGYVTCCDMQCALGEGAGYDPVCDLAWELSAN